MSNISLKIQYGDAIVELSGESTEVNQIFQDIKDNGLGYLTFEKKPNSLKKEADNNVLQNEKQVIKKGKSKIKGTITSTYDMIDLNLNDEQRNDLKQFYSQFSLSTNVQRICTLCYWYKKNTDINEFDTNTVFTLLRTVQEKASFNIPQAFSDIQKRNQYLVSTGMKGKYKLTPVGEDYVADLLKRN